MSGTEICLLIALVVALVIVLTWSVTYNGSDGKKAGGQFFGPTNRSVIYRKCDKICLDCLGVKPFTARKLDEWTDVMGCVPVQVCALLKLDDRGITGFDPLRGCGIVTERRSDGDEALLSALESDLYDRYGYKADVQDGDGVAAKSVCLYCLAKGHFCVRPVSYVVNPEIEEPHHEASGGDENRDVVKS